MGSRWDHWRHSRDFWGWVIVGATALGMLVLAVVLPGIVRLQRILNTPPLLALPDLTGCTRIEIEYHPSILGFFFTTNDSRTLLSPDEIQYVQSLGTLVLEDSESIATIAHEIALASDPMPLFKPMRALRFVRITCYRNGERLSPFITSNGRHVETESGVQFECRLERALRSLASQQLRPFRKRVACAHTLSSLRRKFYLLPGGGKTYPQPSKWCDVFEKDMLAHRPAEGFIEWTPKREERMSERIKESFVCPDMQDSPCHYAINPHCKPNSPPETVLLFETQAGWNQHGGPELFTFDNHDPKGGCVLFNDGSVKFIRIEEELHALRWK